MTTPNKMKSIQQNEENFIYKMGKENLPEEHFQTG
jgi:hypothetical protein